MTESHDNIAHDAPVNVRLEDALPKEPLTAFLSEHIPGFCGPLAVQQFPAGHSNLTYAITSGDGSQYVLRRPPRGANIKSGHDMGREHFVLDHLHPVFPKVPKPLVLCEDPDVIGAPFYVMERVDGVVLRGRRGTKYGLNEAAMRSHCLALIDTLIEIHDIDLREAKLTQFGKPDGYVERQIRGWTGRYERSKTDDIPALELASEWLHQNMPAEVSPSVIHNDYKYDNVSFSPSNPIAVRAVFDWEMATVGDPLMDLGTTLAYWVDAGDPAFLQDISGPCTLPGNLSRAEVAAYYGERRQIDTSSMLFYYIYGLYKVSVIGQQIYFRWKQGHSKDDRFGQLIHAVRALAHRCDDALETGKISGC
jgi:aminoglycoside phosphotransferase (APT) family kinase protein